MDSTRALVLQWEKWADSRCLLKAEPTGLADGWDMGVERERSGGQLPGVWPEALTGERSLFL